MRKTLDPLFAGDDYLKTQAPGCRRNRRCDDAAPDWSAYFAWLIEAPDTRCRHPKTEQELCRSLAVAVAFLLGPLFFSTCFLISAVREFDWPGVIAGVVLGPLILIPSVFILWQQDRERERHCRPDCTCPACTEAEQRLRAGERAALKSAKAKYATSLFDEL